ncbi:MAG TPA: amino acid permease [Cyclobacteriaceae bacterium]|nr:amino acid permease [Cyclobacteriaceae bacterium]
MSLFVKKPLDQLLKSASGDSGLKRTLGPANLIALGIGAIIGAGLFVRTAQAAGEAAGSAVVLSFVVAAVGCAFAGLCYAEFASMIPVAGSAYTYAYVTMGEFLAWIIGWALILEYALASATVAISWSQYLNKLCEMLFGSQIPYEWCHSPFESADGVSGIMNVPALVILLLLTMVLIRGTKGSAMLNSVIVIVKVTIVLLFIALGWQFINPLNHTPMMIPEGVEGHEAFNEFGIGGIFGGASIVFFAFIGFDAVSTAAQEAKNPKRDMPIGILGSLFFCTILYILFSWVLTGVAPWQEFLKAGKEASVAYAIDTYMPGYGWLSTFITIAILAGFSSVILVMLLGQSRVFYSMANDGLMPKVFAELHPKHRTPFKSNWILLGFVAIFGGFVPVDVAGDLTSFGTLFAFVLVCVAVWIMRVKSPEVPRAFKTPWVPFVPIMGILICTLLIITLDGFTQLVAIVWMIVGLIVYFTYGKKNSYLQNKK